MVGTSDSVSIKADGVIAFDYRNCKLGDTQAVATQAGLVAYDNIGTLSGGNNIPCPGSTINQGSSVSGRSLGTVTNDLEYVETQGSSAPEGVIFGYIGNRYRRTSTGKLYIKESGSNTNTGWKLVTAA